MAGPDDAVFFEATPENISIFLIQHQQALRSAIATMDRRAFLTAQLCFIEICPDEEFLFQELLPIYDGMQMGEIPVPELKTVPKEAALAAECPKPDWNYLRWDGYSNRKYQAILSGEGLLDFPWQDKKIPMEIQVRPYYNAGKLDLLLVDWASGEPEKWGSLTTNFGYPVKKDCAFVDVDKLGESILAWIEKNGLGKPTGRKERSGSGVEYPEYHFDPKRLRELDDLGYQGYSEIFDQANFDRRPARKKDQER